MHVMEMKQKGRSFLPFHAPHRERPFCTPMHSCERASERTTWARSRSDGGNAMAINKRSVTALCLLLLLLTEQVGSLARVEVDVLCAPHPAFRASAWRDRASQHWLTSREMPHLPLPPSSGGTCSSVQGYATPHCRGS